MPPKGLSYQGPPPGRCHGLWLRSSPWWVLFFLLVDISRQPLSPGAEAGHCALSVLAPGSHNCRLPRTLVQKMPFWPFGVQIRLRETRSLIRQSFHFSLGNGSHWHVVSLLKEGETKRKDEMESPSWGFSLEAGTSV